MSLTESHVEKRLQAATNSQDSIQTLSLWLLHHRAHHQKIVKIWMKVFRKAKTSLRLTLFYIANDVIQNSKRKNITAFRDSFSSVLKEATALARDDRISQSVSRIFNIWCERNVYTSDFTSELHSILTNEEIDPTSKLVADFKCERVTEKLRLLSKLEVEATAKITKVNISKLSSTNAEIVQKLKDRTHGQQFSSEFDESVRCLEDVVKSLQKEIEERNSLIVLLEQSEVYYNTQRGEVKIVANAYKNFGSRVNTLQKKLEEMTATLPMPSPIPSPCPDAPSPTTSDLEAELELPSEDTPEESSQDESHKNEGNKSSQSQGRTPNSAGKPIPILSSFLPQDIGKMSSWLDSFPEKRSSKIEVPSTIRDGDSLDSRLSNLLQKIPNLSCPSQNPPFKTSFAPASHIATQSKGECSGQNTPLQDEDTSNSISSRSTSVPEMPRSSKDVSKEFTPIFHSALSKETDYNPEWSSKRKEESSKGIHPVQTVLPPPPFFSSRNLSYDVEKGHTFQELLTSISPAATPRNNNFEKSINNNSQEYNPEANDEMISKSKDYQETKIHRSQVELPQNNSMSKENTIIPLTSSSSTSFISSKESISQIKPNLDGISPKNNSASEASNVPSNMDVSDEMDIENETEASSGNSITVLSVQNDEWTRSKIETIQSSRNDYENQLFNNQFDVDYRQEFHGRGSFNQRFNRDSHQNFQRNVNYSNYKNNSRPPKRFYSGRGRRNWSRHSNPY